MCVVLEVTGNELKYTFYPNSGRSDDVSPSIPPPSPGKALVVALDVLSEEENGPGCLPPPEWAGLDRGRKEPAGPDTQMILLPEH
ncbi:hypothetical protein MKZ38_000538 [Zalerion maritima]|uniref:Uncharacterized protein n=1 Tax=Zalerion maritima TaxID=339359 RepID=A0AAD5RST6_9PEZI|nr:hypothetical protein MKZ38_000538 [Zalerion maritima]